MNVLIETLIHHPVLLLVMVLAVGHVVGSVRLGSFSLGVSAVLFTGLFFGSLHPQMHLPEIIQIFGLVLFVYTIGISSGPGFVASFKAKGWRDSLLVFLLLGFAGIALVGLGFLFNLKPAQIAGVYCGALTNTPALAAVLEYIQMHFPGKLAQALAIDPILGYSLGYPAGILSTMTVMWAFQKFWKIDHEAEAQKASGGFKFHPNLTHYTVKVTQKKIHGKTVRELFREHAWEIVFGRVLQAGRLHLVTADTRLMLGDVVTVVGNRKTLEKIIPQIGTLQDRDLQSDRSEIDYRRIFVSNPKLMGKRIRNLKMIENFGAVITRIRRGDVEIVPNAGTVLEMGDRVRVIAYREKMKEVTRFFGDSYKRVSETDILSLSIGIALGILLGITPIPLPGGLTFKLGFAGGPLLVALILGAMGRTRGLVWGIPYSANMSLRQLGVLLFLAGVGTRSGHAFAQALMQGQAWVLMGLAFLISVITTGLTVWIGYRFLKLSYGFLMGMVAGIYTQPAVLSFAVEQSKNEIPNLGYSSAYPVAMISKIIFAQIVLMALLALSGS